MGYKSDMAYVVMREVETVDAIPVAVFLDLETAEGNAAGYNLSMQEKGITGIRFYVRVTFLYT